MEQEKVYREDGKAVTVIPLSTGQLGGFGLSKGSQDKSEGLHTDLHRYVGVL